MNRKNKAALVAFELLPCAAPLEPYLRYWRLTSHGRPTSRGVFFMPNELVSLVFSYSGWMIMECSVTGPDNDERIHNNMCSSDNEEYLMSVLCCKAN